MAEKEVTFAYGALVGDSTFQDTYDSFLNQSAPNTNYGSNIAIAMKAGGGTAQNVGWIAFDIYDWIPPNATVTNAKLELYLLDIIGKTSGWVGIYRCLKKPNESQVTWNACTSSLNWNIAGTKGESDTENDNDDVTKADRRTLSGSYFIVFQYDGGTGLYTVIPYNTTYFNNLVQGWIDGSIDSDRGLIFDPWDHLAAPVRTIVAYPGSAQHGTAARRPRLTVKYTIPSVFGSAKVNEINRFNVVSGPG